MALGVLCVVVTIIGILWMFNLVLYTCKQLGYSKHDKTEQLQAEIYKF